MNKKNSIIIAALVFACIVGVLVFALVFNRNGENTDVSDAASAFEVSDTVSDTESDAEKQIDSVQSEMAPVSRVEITARRHIDAERYVSCTIKIYEKSTDTAVMVEDSQSLIKIRGNSTSTGAKKPFNIKFSKKTNLFGFGENTRWSLLANCYDKSLVRNQTVYDFAASIGLDYTPSYRVTEVYLNGECLGAYLLCDPIDVSEDRIDIDNEGSEAVIEYVVPTRNEEGMYYFTTPVYGYRFAVREPEQPTYSQKNQLNDFIRQAEKALQSGDYTKVQNYFDIDSMVNFYIVNELFKNVDIAIGSTFFYIKDNKIHGGPVWDFDLSAGNCSYDYFNYYEYNNIMGQGNGSGKNWEGVYCNKLWFKQLLNYKEFSAAVTNRYKEIQPIVEDLYLDTSENKSYIRRITNYYKDLFSKNYDQCGWSIKYPYCEYERQTPESTYEGNVEFFRSWLKKRNQWLKNNWNIK